MDHSSNTQGTLGTSLRRWGPLQGLKGSLILRGLLEYFLTLDTFIKWLLGFSLSYFFSFSFSSYF